MAYRPYPSVGRAHRQVTRHSPKTCGRYIGRGEYCGYPVAPGLATCAFHNWRPAPTQPGPEGDR